jgi:hypothetical protein
MKAATAAARRGGALLPGGAARAWWRRRRRRLNTSSAVAARARAPLSPPLPPPPFFLVPRERDLFRVLAEVREAHFPRTTLRVAGGWVRDRILGRTSSDVDIVLDDVDGVTFATALTQHLENTAMKRKTSNKMYVVKKNPAQSKHLESASMKLFGLELDFVNLRTEDYGDDNDGRVPTSVSFGTAEMDASRRDLTINALFYNIEEDKVEDFTGRGLADISTNTLRTPPGRPAMDTLLEDPLRAVRSIRFASTLGFAIHEELWSAICHADVHCALRSKVSRERISVELVKMILKHQQPAEVKGGEVKATEEHAAAPRALEPLALIGQSGLHDVFFPVREAYDSGSSTPASVGFTPASDAWSADRWEAAAQCTDAATKALVSNGALADGDGNGDMKRTHEDLLLSSVLSGITVCVPDFYQALPEKRGGWGLFRHPVLNSRATITARRLGVLLPIETVLRAYLFSRRMNLCKKVIQKQITRRYVQRLCMPKRIARRISSIACGAWFAPLGALGGSGGEGVGVGGDDEDDGTHVVEELAMVWAWARAFGDPGDSDPAVAIGGVYHHRRATLEGVSSDLSAHAHGRECDDIVAATARLHRAISELGGAQRMLEQDKSGKLLTGDDVLTTFPELKRRNDIGIILFAHKLWMAVRFCNTLSHRHSAGWEDLEQPDALATARDEAVEWLRMVIVPNADLFFQLEEPYIK